MLLGNDHSKALHQVKSMRNQIETDTVEAIKFEFFWSLKWPIEELQFLALKCWLYNTALDVAR